jgi:hypothetical protein
MCHSEPRSVFERGEESAFFAFSCEQQIPHPQSGLRLTSERFSVGCLAEELQGRSTGLAAWIGRLPFWQSATDSEINSRLSEGKRASRDPFRKRGLRASAVPFLPSSKPC